METNKSDKKFSHTQLDLNFLTNNMQELLSFCSEHANMSAEDAAALYMSISKRKAVGKVMNLDNIKHRTKPHQSYIYVKRKQYAAANDEELIELLYSTFCSEIHTIYSLFPRMLIYKRDCCGASPKTLKEYSLRWKKLQRLDVVYAPITKITTKDMTEAFQQLLKLYPKTTESAYRDLKSVLNAVFNYAISLDIIGRSPIDGVDKNVFRFYVEFKKKEILTPAQRKILIEHLDALENYDAYDLAIMFDLCVLARIGEIKALRWTDVNMGDSSIIIQRQILSHQKMEDNQLFLPTEHIEVDYVKSNRQEGFRKMPLIPTALRVLEKARKLNGNDEHIFFNNGNALTTVTFNRRAKAHCEACGLPDISSHDIRFSVASAMYQENIAPTVLQKLLGHTTLATTLRYLLNTDDISTMANAMAKVLE